MTDISIFLFNRMELYCDGNSLLGLTSGKVQELFCYLLLNRQAVHHREALAEQLWGRESAAASRKQLRQAIWQLLKSINAQLEEMPFFLVESDWIQINPGARYWLDIAAFEKAFIHVQDIPGRLLDGEQVHSLADATRLYRGELLNGRYNDWCMLERDRLRNMYLEMLDRLMENCEYSGKYEAGLKYGESSLKCDPTQERTHQHLMRLYYLSGNRAAALQQYDRCVDILRQELNAMPEANTVELYRQIRSGQFLFETSHARLIDHLKHVQLLLAEAQQQIQRDIQALELKENSRPGMG